MLHMRNPRNHPGPGHLRSLEKGGFKTPPKPKMALGGGFKTPMKPKAKTSLGGGY